MKRLFVFSVLFALALSCSEKGPELPETNDGEESDLIAFTSRALPVNRDGKNDGTVDIRFYEDMPNVPYISFSDFQSLILPGSKMTVVKTASGRFELENKGGKASVNTIDEVFSCSSFMSFFNIMDLTQPGMDNTYLDGLACVRYSSQDVIPGRAVTLDYGPYGIDLRASGDAVYIPFCTVADLYSDIHYHYAACNGEKVVVVDTDMGEGSVDSLEPDFSYESLIGKEDRPDDLIKYSYAELCFVLENFYGRPGRSAYETRLYADGLDKTLLSFPEGQQIRDLLLSRNMKDYAAGLDFLSIIVNDGGHSIIGTAKTALTPENGYSTSVPGLYELYVSSFLAPSLKQVTTINELQEHRKTLFPDGATYHKLDDTAICHFDSFSDTDLVAWNNYYSGVGPIPSMESCPKDPIVVFLDALTKAQKDPSVKNFVLDLTLNGGGSLDVVVAMTSLMYGQSFARCENTLTGEKYIWNYQIDRNFDGKFDAEDDKVNYDLNYCILTTGLSFSCGNLFPSLCRDAGVMVAGERSGGGSCAIITFRTPEGFSYHLSSVRGRLADKDWHNIDSGIVPDVEIGLGPGLYDLSFLSSAIKEFYH